MKLLIFLFTLSLSVSATADTVKKWTDRDGNVHYGDKKAAEYIKETETLKIKDTYDQQSYDEGVKRHNETKKYADKLERERLAEEEKKREAELNKPVSYPPSSGRTVRINPSVRRAEGLRNRTSEPGNRTRPAQLPAKRN